MKNNLIHLLIIGFATICSAYISALPKIDGERVYLYNEASSSAKAYTKEEYIAEQGYNFFCAGAESSFTKGKCDVLEILKKYRATIKRVEHIEGVSNYYCKSLILPAGIRLFEEEINLHIAVAEYGYSVGYPIVCGGY